MTKNIEELFSLPTGLTFAARIEGLQLYSSEKLKESFLRSFLKSGRGKPIYSNIEKMISNNLIIPCYLSKNLFRLVKHKIMGAEQKSILGFYYIRERKVYVLIDNSISLFGTASNDKLVSTTMHECMHLCAGRYRIKFLALYKPILHTFYQNVFKGIFKAKEPINPTKIITFMSKFENSPPRDINKSLGQYSRILEDEIADKTTLSKQEFRKTLVDYFVSLKISMINFAYFMKVYGKFLHIYRPLYSAYEQTFGKRNTYTTVFQELYVPSEVICVLSEMIPTSSIIKKAFKIME